MKTRHVRAFSFALASLLSVGTLVSCGGSAPAMTNDTTAAPSDDTTAPAETQLADGLGEYDFGGRAFNIVYSAEQLGALWPYTSDELNGDVLSDAVYTRDQKVEERFNCRIVFHDKGGQSSKQMEAFRSSIMAGDGSFDLCINHMYNGFNAAIADGLLYDFNKLPCIDLTKPWWNQSIKENLEIDGVLLTEVSDLVYAYWDVIYFNKNMMDDFGIAYPYDKVKEGKWTWTYLAEITKNVSKDLNGDGKFDGDDQWGAVIDLNTSTMTRLIHSNGLVMAQIGDDGKPTLSGMMSDKMQTVIERYYDFVWGDGRSYYPLGEPTSSTIPIDTFAKGHSLVLHTQTVKLPSLRDVTFEFGIVPLPKFDEAQEKYLSMASTQMLLLPIDMADPTFVGVVLEALSAESYREVVPKLYDVVYENKLLRDEESQDMFELIRSSLVYDFNWNYGNGNSMSYLIGRTVGQNSKDFSSYYASNINAAQKVLDDVVEAVHENYIGK